MASNLAVARAFIAGKPARSGNGNLRSDGTNLWSYNTPIARLHSDAKGRTVVLHWAHEYSATTTGKHRTALLKACDYGRCRPEWQVPAIGIGGGRKLISYLDHEMNVLELRRVIREEEERIAKARVYKDAGRLEMLKLDLRTYTDAFGLPADMMAS